MASDQDDPSRAPDVGREMVDQGGGIGTVAAHLYRGEVDRAVNWRTRLDSTTNWAVTIIAGILAYAFSNSQVSHAIVLVGMLIAVVFVFVEARRFQRYDIWRSRVRTLQENLFAAALDPPEGVEQRDWRARLSEDYRSPAVKMPLQNALAHRLRRVYLPLVTGLVLVWSVRLSGADEPLLQAASVASVPGPLVVGTVLVSYAVLFVVAVWPDPETATETGSDSDLDDLDHRN